MLEFLPIDRPIDQSINSLMSYLALNNAPRVTEWHHIVFKPFLPLVPHRLFYYEDGPDAFICFLVYQGATFLPDWASRALQLYGGYHLAENAANLYWIQELLYKFLSIFSRMCQWRIFLSLWLIFNPYTYPWRILVELTEWFVEGFNGVLPTFFGIDYSGAFALSGLSIVIKYIKNLVFTMPYLPSEAIKERIGKYPFYRFSGFPRLWKEYGIPNELREEWYDNQPEVIEHFLKYYGDLGQDIVPTRIVEEYYNEYIKDTTIPISLANFDHFSTNAISSLNHVFETDLLANQIIPIYERLLDNF
jgi:uncharacterized protein YggT (Ycf19 family)